MKRILLFASLLLAIALQTKAQDCYELTIQNNTSCPVYYGLVTSNAQVYPNPNCTTTNFSSLIMIPAGGFQKWNASSAITMPPGITAPPAGSTYYFLISRIYGSSGGCGGAITLGATCTGLPQSGSIALYNASCVPICNANVTWTQPYTGIVSVTIN